VRSNYCWADEAMDSTLEKAYAAPFTSVNDRDDRSDPGPDGVRLAGVLLLIAAAVAGATWVVQLLWNWSPRWTAVLEAVAQIGLGVGLLRRGRQWALPTLVILGAFAALPILHVWSAFTRAGIAVLIGPIVFASARMLPPGLLLIGRPGAARVKAAVAVFIAGEVLIVAAAVLQMLLVERMANR
jgi:hypothetical protein